MSISEIFPQKVYRCDCLTDVIRNCFYQNLCSIKDICQKIEENIREKIYCVLCGEYNKDVVFSCKAHMAMTVLVVEQRNNIVISLEDGHCLSCIKNYLHDKYFVYGYETFNCG